MLTSSRIIHIFCMNCRTQLLTYRKGGKGQLVKIRLHKIVKDFTVDKGFCPECGTQFGREAVIRNKPALKVIGGKLFYK